MCTRFGLPGLYPGRDRAIYPRRSRPSARNWYLEIDFLFDKTMHGIIFRPPLKELYSGRDRAIYRRRSRPSTHYLPKMIISNSLNNVLVQDSKTLFGT